MAKKKKLQNRQYQKGYGQGFEDGVIYATSVFTYIYSMDFVSRVIDETFKKKKRN